MSDIPKVPGDFLMNEGRSFPTQAYFAKLGIWLKDLKIQTPKGFMYLSQWIDEVAAASRIDPVAILTYLQAEQGLLRTDKVRNPAFKITALPNKPPFDPYKYAGYAVPPEFRNAAGDPTDKPSVSGVDVKVVRNGGPKHTADGNWYVKLEGDFAMAFALGVGAPDPGHFPAWDVRKYIGLANQIQQFASLMLKYAREYSEKSLTGDVRGMTLTVYDKGADGKALAVVPADQQTWQMIRFNPSLGGLEKRPKIAAGIRAEAKGFGLVA